MKNLLLVFTENYPRGGGNRYMIDLINGIIEDFQDVIISSNPNGVYLEELERLSNQVKTLGVFFLSRTRLFIGFKEPNSLIVRLARKSLFFLDPIFLIVNIFLFLALLLKTKPARILVCNGSYPASQACLAMVIAARICRIHVTMSIVSVPGPRGFSRYYEKILDLMVWRCVTLVLVNAYAIKNALVSLRDAKENKIMVLYNGVEETSLNRTYNSNPSVLNIGLISRLDEAKGVLILLEAFIELASSYDNIHLTLAGKGDASERLERRVIESGLQHRVSMLGYYEGDTDLFFNQIDIFTFPSLWEGMPYTIIEAMRAGCPIVSTDIGGISEAITHGREGVLVKPGSKDLLVKALSLLINDYTKRKEMAVNARSRFIQNFTLSKMHQRANKVIIGSEYL